MEAQLQRPTTHEYPRYDEDPHLNVPSQSVMEGEGGAEHNHQGEKKSVLKKVKDKAKKIKDKIKHGGHAHDGEDYDDEDEETVVSPDLHAAPIKEDAFISGTNLPKQTGLNLGNKITPPENPSVIGNVGGPAPHPRNEIGNDPFPTKLENETTPVEDLQISSQMEEEAYKPSITREQLYSGVDVGSGPTSTATVALEPQANVAEPTVKIGPLMDLDKDPHSPGQISPPNYQTKVRDPTAKGGAEADVAPLVERLGDLHVDDNNHQFASESTPINEQLKTETEPKSFDADRPESMPQDTVAGKITSVIADKASSAKNVVASKLGYGSTQSQESHESSKPTTLESVSGYVAEKLGPVYGKAAGAMVPKVEGKSGGEGVESDKGVSVQQYLAEKFSPGDEDKELSKVITDAIHRKKKERAPEDEVKETGEEDRVKETVRIEAIARDDKAAAGVVDRVKGAIGSWLGKNHGEGEGLQKAEVSKLQETGN